MNDLFDWPGKSDEDRGELSAIHHMLDVAACAEQLIENHAAFTTLTKAQRQALVVLVTLHDVGKISDSFCALIRCGKKGAPRTGNFRTSCCVKYLMIC